MRYKHAVLGNFTSKTTIYKWTLPLVSVIYRFRFNIKTMLWKWNQFFCAISQFVIIYVWICRKLIKVTAQAIKGGNFDVTTSVFPNFKIANWDIQKNCFHYNTLVFMLKLILWITHTTGRVHFKHACFYYRNVHTTVYNVSRNAHDRPIWGFEWWCDTRKHGTGNQFWLLSSHYVESNTV